MKVAALGLLLLSGCANLESPNVPVGNFPFRDQTAPIITPAEVLKLFEDHCLAHERDDASLDAMVAKYGMTARRKSDVIVPYSFKAATEGFGYDIALSFRQSVGQWHISYVGEVPNDAPTLFYSCQIKALVPLLTPDADANLKARIEGQLTQRSKAFDYKARTTGYAVKPTDVTLKYTPPSKGTRQHKSGHPDCAGPDPCYYSYLAPMELDLTVVVDRFSQP